MSINPLQSFDWSYTKLLTSGLKKWTCFLKLQNRLTRKNQVFQWAEVQRRTFEDKERYSKHTCLSLRLRKACHDTD